MDQLIFKKNVFLIRIINIFSKKMKDNILVRFQPFSARIEIRISKLLVKKRHVFVSGQDRQVQVSKSSSPLRQNFDACWKPFSQHLL